MSENIIKGPISDVSYKTAYDDDGIEHRSYNFTLDGKKFTCRLPKLEHLSEGEVMIIEYKKKDNAYEMVSGLHTLRNYKWGNTSALKSYKNEADIYTFVEGKIIEKRKLDMVSTPVGKERQPANFTIVLERVNFTVPNHVGIKLKKNEEIGAVLTEDFASIVYNKTNKKYHGVKYPYFIVFILAAIALPLTIFYLQSIGNNMFVKPKATIIVLDSFFLFFALINFVGYRSSNAAKRFLDKHLSK